MTSLQRRVLLVSILASLVAFLDGSVVNVALPAMAHELSGGLVLQQWVVDAYLITLGALILIAGSLSDLVGRRRVLAAGLIGFAVASVACALATSSGFLIGARAVQGLAGALLVPSSLALIIANFSGAAQARAIGIWTAWTGIAFIIGPLVGGLLVDAASWRWVFGINILPIAVTLWLLGGTPRDRLNLGAVIDWLGAALCTLGLAGSVFALIEQPHYGWSAPIIWLPLAIGIVALGAFIWLEDHVAAPMLPLELFRSRNFSVGNLATILIYAGLSVATFLLVVFVQQVGHYSALAAGLSLLPVTIIMFVLSPRFGALAGRFGPRLFMALGPVIAGIGFSLLLLVTSQVNYWAQLFPGIVVFGVGLSMTVAPLTAAVLGSISKDHAGIGSAINNAIARIAGLVATAAIGVIVGGRISVGGFHRAVVVMALLLLAGGVVSAIGITNAAVQAGGTKQATS